MISSKISISVGIFYRLRSIVPGKVLLNLCYYFVYPSLLYCIAIWSGIYSSML